MIVTMINWHTRRRSILVVVLEPANLERMRRADACTLESERSGGALKEPEYPQDFCTLIAYEEDTDELMRMARIGGLAFLAWPARGRKFDPSAGDGTENAKILAKDQFGEA